MALERPTALDSVPADISKRSADLARDLAQIELTKFRFRIGCGLECVSVFLFIFGHIKTGWFVPQFTDRSWQFAIWLLIMGAAFSSKEVIRAFVDGIKSIVGKS